MRFTTHRLFRLLPSWRAWQALALAVPLAACAAERYEGLAYARANGRLLYKETHWRYQDEGGSWRHLVLYGCPDGAAFARKRLTESPTAQAPDFDFHDARDGYREGVRTAANGQREVYAQTSAAARTEARPLGQVADAVIDAGFDAFIRARWPALSAGGSMKVPFLIPSRFDYLDFKIADARDDKVDGVPVRRLRMKLSAWYGFALPSIELAYTRDGARLVEFQGMGTIRDAQGRHQDVRIVFPPQGRVDDAPPSDIAAALAHPLTAQCHQGAGG